MSGRTIPASVIEVAAELVRLFDRERELALALNEASDRLQAGNDQLTAGPSAECRAQVRWHGLRIKWHESAPDLRS